MDLELCALIINARLMKYGLKGQHVENTIKLHFHPLQHLGFPHPQADFHELKNGAHSTNVQHQFNNSLIHPLGLHVEHIDVLHKQILCTDAGLCLDVTTM